MTETEEIMIAFFMTGTAAFLVSVLLVAIILKAGLRKGGWFFAGFGPIVAFACQTALIVNGTLTPTEGVALFMPIGLLPYLILAFKSWPIPAMHVTRPETFK